MSVDYPETEYDLTPSHWEKFKNSSFVNKIILLMLAVIIVYNTFSGQMDAVLFLAVGAVFLLFDVFHIQYERDRLKAERDYYREQLEGGDQE